MVRGEMSHKNRISQRGGETKMGKERLMRVSVWLGSIVLAGLLLVVSWAAYDRYGAVPAVGGQSVEITHVTAGIIDAETLIAVRFRLPQVGGQDATGGKRLAQNPFVFAPHIAGEAYWEDGQTLVFKPAQPLYAKRDYSAVLNLAGGEEKIRFEFSTRGGQAILEEKGQFVAAGEGRAYFWAQLRFCSG